MGFDPIKEAVPIFVKRVGDRVIEGSNNSIMIFGTDRAAPAEAKLDSGYGHAKHTEKGVGAGSWHVIVGRDGENPNFKTDKSYIYLCSKTDVDNNIENKFEFTTNKTAAVIIKSEAVRVVANQNIKIISNNTYITLNGKDSLIIEAPKNIFLGTAATHPVIYGDVHKATYNAMIKVLNNLIDAFNSHNHLDSNGSTTSPPIISGGAGGSSVPIPEHPQLLLPPPAGPGIPKGPLNPERRYIPGGAVAKAAEMQDSDLSSVVKTK